MTMSKIYSWAVANEPEYGWESHDAMLAAYREAELARIAWNTWEREGKVKRRRRRKVRDPSGSVLGSCWMGGYQS